MSLGRSCFAFLFLASLGFSAANDIDRRKEYMRRHGLRDQMELTSDEKSAPQTQTRKSTDLIKAEEMQSNATCADQLGELDMLAKFYVLASERISTYELHNPPTLPFITGIRVVNFHDIATSDIIRIYKNIQELASNAFRKTLGHDNAQKLMTNLEELNWKGDSVFEQLIETLEAHQVQVFKLLQRDSLSEDEWEDLNDQLELNSAEPIMSEQY